MENINTTTKDTDVSGLFIKSKLVISAIILGILLIMIAGIYIVNLVNPNNLDYEASKGFIVLFLILIPILIPTIFTKIHSVPSVKLFFILATLLYPFIWYIGDFERGIGPIIFVFILFSSYFILLISNIVLSILWDIVFNKKND